MLEAILNATASLFLSEAKKVNYGIVDVGVSLGIDRGYYMACAKLHKQNKQHGAMICAVNAARVSARAARMYNQRQG